MQGYLSNQNFHSASHLFDATLIHGVWNTFNELFFTFSIALLISSKDNNSSQTIDVILSFVYSMLIFVLYRKGCEIIIKYTTHWVQNRK